MTIKQTSVNDNTVVNLNAGSLEDAQFEVLQVTSGKRTISPTDEQRDEISLKARHFLKRSINRELFRRNLKVTKFALEQNTKRQYLYRILNEKQNAASLDRLVQLSDSLGMVLEVSVKSWDQYEDEDARVNLEAGALESASFEAAQQMTSGKRTISPTDEERDEISLRVRQFLKARINQELDRQSLKITKFARQQNTKRQYLYRILDKKQNAASLDRLVQLADSLGMDVQFRIHVPNDFESNTQKA